MSESNLAEEKQNGQSHGNMSLLSAPESVLMKSLAEAFWYTKTMFLSKHVQTIVASRQRDAQTIKILGADTLLR